MPRLEEPPPVENPREILPQVAEMPEVSFAAPRIPPVPRGEAIFGLNSAASLLAQVNALLEVLVERGWDGKERDLAAVGAEIYKGRLEVQSAYFRVHAACGLLVPKVERPQKES